MSVFIEAFLCYCLEFFSKLPAEGKPVTQFPRKVLPTFPLRGNMPFFGQTLQGLETIENKGGGMEWLFQVQHSWGFVARSTRKEQSVGIEK